MGNATRSKARGPLVSFANSIMFREAMRRAPELSKELLERALGFPIACMEMVHPERAIDPAFASHGVRSDLCAKGSDQVMDVELQAVKEPSLERRMRYYQGALDASVLEKGTAYDQLPESHIIFLSKSDPFGYPIPRYSIESVCREEEVDLEVGPHWLVYNAEASEHEKDAGLRKPLSYRATGTKTNDDPLICGIAEQVQTVSDNEETMAMTFSVQDEIVIQARAAFLEGEAEGEEEGEA